MNPEDLLKFLEKILIAGEDYPSYVNLAAACETLEGTLEDLKNNLEWKVRYIADIKNQAFPSKSGQPYEHLDSYDRINGITIKNGFVIVTNEGSDFRFPMELLDMSSQDVENYYVSLRVKGEIHAAQVQEKKLADMKLAQDAQDRAEYERLKSKFESENK